ncbi:MAG: polyprenyl synthetase family protein [Prevotellaceae bacterium]|nr:polyprenyl synthetase family protein [Prevotellaceae bacterium]
MKDYLASISQPVSTELQRYQCLLSATLQHDNALLHAALEHLLQRKGKGMRPILVLLSAKYAGKVNDRVLNAAVALELLHTASLVHDDIIDESDQRRGQQSVNALFGNKVAVLVGDFLFSRALTHACLCACPEFSDWLACLGQTLSDGELRQLARTGSTDFSEEAYYDVIEKKTASLFSLCAKAGAHLAGGSSEDVRSMELFGKYVGVCFQLKDDIFDYDTQNATGKPTGNDMKEGKLTLPVIHSLNA